MTNKQIKELGHENILKIVLYWYTNIEPRIFQDEDGQDLEEILEPQVY